MGAVVDKAKAQKVNQFTTSFPLAHAAGFFLCYTHLEKIYLSNKYIPIIVLKNDIFQ